MRFVTGLRISGARALGTLALVPLAAAAQVEASSARADSGSPGALDARLVSARQQTLAPVSPAAIGEGGRGLSAASVRVHVQRSGTDSVQLRLRVTPPRGLRAAPAWQSTLLARGATVLSARVLTSPATVGRLVVPVILEARAPLDSAWTIVLHDSIEVVVPELVALEGTMRDMPSFTVRGRSYAVRAVFTNRGNVPLTLRFVGVSGSDASNLMLDRESGTISPRDSLTIHVRMVASGTGSRATESALAVDAYQGRSPTALARASAGMTTLPLGGGASAHTLLPSVLTLRSARRRDPLPPIELTTRAPLGAASAITVDLHLAGPAASADAPIGFRDEYHLNLDAPGWSVALGDLFAGPAPTLLPSQRALTGVHGERLALSRWGEVAIEGTVATARRGGAPGREASVSLALAPRELPRWHVGASATSRAGLESGEAVAAETRLALAHPWLGATRLAAGAGVGRGGGAHGSSWRFGVESVFGRDAAEADARRGATDPLTAPGALRVSLLAQRADPSMPVSGRGTHVTVGSVEIPVGAQMLSVGYSRFGASGARSSTSLAQESEQWTGRLSLPLALTLGATRHHSRVAYGSTTAVNDYSAVNATLAPHIRLPAGAVLGVLVGGDLGRREDSPTGLATPLSRVSVSGTLTTSTGHMLSVGREQARSGGVSTATASGSAALRLLKEDRLRFVAQGSASRVGVPGAPVLALGEAALVAADAGRRSYALRVRVRPAGFSDGGTTLVFETGLPFGLYAGPRREPGLVQGTVVDATTSAPLAGALVRIADQLSLTDAAGRVRFASLAPGTPSVTVVPDPLSDSQLAWVPVVPATVRIDSASRRPATFRVAMAPAARVRVRVARYDRGLSPEDSLRETEALERIAIAVVGVRDTIVMQTSTDGSAESPRLAPGTWRVSIVGGAAPPRYVFEREEDVVVLNAGATRELVFRVVPKRARVSIAVRP